MSLMDPLPYCVLTVFLTPKEVEILIFYLPPNCKDCCAKRVLNISCLAYANRIKNYHLLLCL